MRKVEKAELRDLDIIYEVYANARRFMALHGNKDQWKDSHPSKILVNQFLAEGNLYKVINDLNEILGVFAFIIGEDPTYRSIEGEWLNDEKYGTIHALASSFKEKGILKDVVSFCSTKISNLKIDTSIENVIMKKAIINNGFKECGIIHISNGDPRIAYQLIQ